MNTLQAGAEFSSSTIGGLQIPIGRSAEPIVRSHPTPRPVPPLSARAGTTPASIEAETSTSIFFASVDAVQRALAARVTLDPVETACAETYRRPADRERYLAARMLLRHALSKAVDGKVAPEDWHYHEGPQGKPMMADGLPALQFNVSHSGNCVAVAVGRGDPIGIDIECLRPDQSLGVIHGVLSDGEQIRMRKCPASQQWNQFVRLWTAKEAAAKALGLGLSLDFSTIDVQLDPLRVRLLYPPMGVAAEFDVASTTLTKNGKPYVLTVARLTGERQVC